MTARAPGRGDGPRILSARGVGLRVLAGQGAQIDTTPAAGRLVFGIFAARCPTCAANSVSGP